VIRARLAVLLTVALAGCAAGGPPRIGADTRGQFTATEVVVHVPQKEFDADWAGTTISDLNTLIGSAFDSDRQMSKDPTKAMESLRAALEDFDFDRHWTGAVDGALREASWLNAQPATLVKDEKFPNMLAARKSTTPGMVVLSSRYALSADLSTLRIVTFACVFMQKRPAVRDCGSAKYRNLLTYSVRWAKLKTMEQNAEAWVADDSLRKSLEAGSKALAGMLVADVSNPLPPSQGAVRSVMVQGKSVQALSAEDSADGTTVRYPNGSIEFFATPLK
jgi:hypothetical protein